MNSKSIEDILNAYSFPHRFLVRYAVVCAEKAMEYVKDPDEKAIKAIALAKRFGAGEDATKDVLSALVQSADDLYPISGYIYSRPADSRTAVAAAAYHSVSVAYSAPYPAYSAGWIRNVCGAVICAIYAPKSNLKKIKCSRELRNILIRMIKEEYSKVELTLMENKW